MATKILLFIFCLFVSTAFAQPEPCETKAEDNEQHELELCYNYSNRFGYEVEKIDNPKLYKTIGEWLGTSYCYAGNSKNGVDCSGFVNALYKSVYSVDLPGSSVDIFKQAKPLKKSQLREGDLVFFKIRKKRVSHVGIYLGQNKFAHASVHEGVIISDLDDPYYRKYFYRGGKIKT